MITYKLSLGIGFHGAKHEDEITVGEMGFNEDDWIAIDADSKDAILNEHWKIWSLNFIDGGWSLIDG